MQFQRGPATVNGRLLQNPLFETANGKEQHAITMSQETCLNLARTAYEDRDVRTDSGVDFGTPLLPFDHLHALVRGDFLV